MTPEMSVCHDKGRQEGRGVSGVLAGLEAELPVLGCQVELPGTAFGDVMAYYLAELVPEGWNGN